MCTDRRSSHPPVGPAAVIRDVAVGSTPHAGDLPRALRAGATGRAHAVLQDRVAHTLDEQGAAPGAIGVLERPDAAGHVAGVDEPQPLAPSDLRRAHNGANRGL